MKRLAIAGAILASALVVPAWAGAAELSKTTIRAADGTEVPVEVATPAGKGPFPSVLFIHAKRGYEGDERAHVRELAEQGFLVVAPDWQSGRFIERWPSAHNPETEMDVEAGLDYLKSLPNACRQPVGIVGLSRGPYYAIRLAAKRSADIAAIVSYYGHMQNPNAPEPDQFTAVSCKAYAPDLYHSSHLFLFYCFSVNEDSSASTPAYITSTNNSPNQR